MSDRKPMPADGGDGMKGAPDGVNTDPSGQREQGESVIRRGEEVLAEVKSSWCCLDALTMRPARLAQDVIEHFFPSIERQPER